MASTLASKSPSIIVLSLKILIELKDHSHQAHLHKQLLDLLTHSVDLTIQKCIVDYFSQVLPDPSHQQKVVDILLSTKQSALFQYSLGFLRLVRQDLLDNLLDDLLAHLQRG